MPQDAERSNSHQMRTVVSLMLKRYGKVKFKLSMHCSVLMPQDVEKSNSHQVRTAISLTPQDVETSNSYPDVL